MADIIDAKTQEIRPQDDEVYSKMEDLADDLPESSPRFILLSYPLTTVGVDHNLNLMQITNTTTHHRRMVVLLSLTFYFTGSPKTATRCSGCRMPTQWS